MRYLVAFLIAALCVPGDARAQGAHAQGGAPSERPRSEAALARYPQPVRVGDLGGRSVIEDTQQQAVLGRVLGAMRGADGKLGILMEQGGFLGFRTRWVVVPMEAMALLGQLVVLKDIEPAQLAALPNAPAQPNLLPSNTIVLMGLARN